MSVSFLHAVLFDLDGLLADTEPLHYASWRDVIQEVFGVIVSWDEYCEHWIRRGLSIREYLARHELVGDAEELWRRKSHRYLPLVEAHLQPMPGALELLGRLYGRTPLALASSSWRTHVDAVLRKLGARHVFDAVATGESVSRLKPHPDIFLHTAEQLGAVPGRCVVLEDAEKGVLAARAAGMAVVVIPTPYSATHDLSSASRMMQSLEDVTLEELDSIVGATFKRG